MPDVHVRSAESLMAVRDHRLEPLGSRTYQAASIWGTCYVVNDLATTTDETRAARALTT